MTIDQGSYVRFLFRGVGAGTTVMKFTDGRNCLGGGQTALVARHECTGILMFFKAG